MSAEALEITIFYTESTDMAVEVPYHSDSNNPHLTLSPLGVTNL